MLLLYYCYHISNVNLLLYLCATKYQNMSGKYIKIITFLGLLVIVIIQSVWLVKTYQLIELHCDYPECMAGKNISADRAAIDSIRKPYISQIRIERSVGKAQYHNRIIR